MGIDFEAEERNEVDAEGNTYFLKSGVDEGDDGYRCRWTVQGRTSREGFGNTARRTGRRRMRAGTKSSARS